MVDGKRNLLTGVPDCATYFGDDTTNVVLYAKGKSPSDETTKELGEGQLLLPTLKAFTINPKKTILGVV